MRKKVVAKKPVAKAKSAAPSTGKGVEIILKNEPNSQTHVLQNGKKVAIQSIRLSAGHTMNLGDFESARIDVGVTVAPIDSVTVEEMMEAGWSIVYEELRNKIRDIKKKTGKNTDAGLGNG